MPETDVHGAPRPAARLRRRARPHRPGSRGHEGRHREGRGDRGRARRTPSCAQQFANPANPGDPPPDHGRGDLGGHRRPGRHPRRRRRHRRHHHRRRRRCSRSASPGVQIIAVEPKDSADPHRRPARPAQDPGHRRGLRPRDPRHRHLRRGHRRHRAGPPSEWPATAAPQEGLLVGISSGAVVWPPLRRWPKRPENAGKTHRRHHPDFGERYLSTVLYDDIRG